MCCVYGTQVGAVPLLRGMCVGVCPPPFVRFFVLSRFVTKSMARRILGGWSGCTLMWFHVLSVVAVRSMNVRDPNWGTLGAFLGPLVDQWNCKRSGRAEHN